MKMYDITQKIYELQEEIEEFMWDLSGERYECTVRINGDTTEINLDGDLEFIEIVLDEFENFYVEIKSPTFKYTDDLIAFLEFLEF